jgi:hypothetical protein
MVDNFSSELPSSLPLLPTSSSHTSTQQSCFLNLGSMSFYNLNESSSRELQPSSLLTSNLNADVAQLSNFTPHPYFIQEEKLLHKRQLHKLVEKKRRQTMNECIEELSGLLPIAEKNKGKILQATVSYLKSLIQETKEQKELIALLEEDKKRLMSKFFL